MNLDDIEPPELTDAQWDAIDNTIAAFAQLDGLTNGQVMRIMVAIMVRVISDSTNPPKRLPYWFKAMAEAELRKPSLVWEPRH